MRVLDLFAGIGGFSLGLHRAGGFETVAFCEIGEYPRKVLAKHWPNVPIYEDVRNVTGRQLTADGITVDVITGGFPCQDISCAGNQAGIGEGTRSGLWSEIARLVGEIRPKYVIVENVAALLSGPTEQRGGWFGSILRDLAAIGYDAEWHSIPASSIGAHHHRDRVWIIAYPQSRGNIRGCGRVEGQDGTEKVSGSSRNVKESIDDCQDDADTNSPQCEGGRIPIRIQQKHSYSGSGSGWKAEPGVGRVADGVPNGPHRLKGLGNAVVPQIPELIGLAILEAEQWGEE